MIQERQPSYYAIIPSTVRYDEQLKFAERLLYGEITALIGKEGYCFASNNYFAKLYGVIPGTISRWISHLDKLGYIKVELIKNDKKEVIERRIFITDISCRKIMQDTYKQNSIYPYKQFEQYPMSKKAKENNLNIRIDDTLFNYIIKKEGKLPREFKDNTQYERFYSVIKKLEFDYTEDIIRTFKEENIEKLKTIIYCLKELFIKNKEYFLMKVTREELIEIYDNCKKFETSYQNTEKEIRNFFDYYYISVIKKIEAKYI